MASTDTIVAHWAIEALDVPDHVAETMSTYRWWSGEGSLTLAGETYQGVREGDAVIAELSEYEQTEDVPDTRLSLRFIIDEASLRAVLNEDVGAVSIRIHWLVSTDQGATYSKLGSFFGRLSSPVINGRVFTAEVETWLGDIDRPVAHHWTDDEQQRRHPGDRGFEFVQELSDGFNIQWPP